MIDHDKVDLMTQIDSIRRGWAACEETVSSGAAIQDALRASLHDLEKRHKEAELALEVARRDRDAAIARAAGLLERLAKSHGPHFLFWREVQVILRAEAARLRGVGQ